MTKYLQVIFSGVAVGSIYALVGLGISFAYRVTGLVNFAHGAVVATSGLVMARMIMDGWSVWIALAAGVVIGGLIGAILGVGLLYWLDAQRRLTAAMLTVGISFLIEGLNALKFDKDPLGAPPPVTLPSLEAFGAVLPGRFMGPIIGVVASSIVLVLWLQRTGSGARLQAAVQDQLGASVVGIDVHKVAVVAFMASGILAGLAGVLAVPVTSMGYDFGGTLLISGLTAAVVGGLSVTTGAVAGGLGLGLVEALAATQISSIFAKAVSVMLLIGIMALRPQGLLGRIAR